MTTNFTMCIEMKDEAERELGAMFLAALNSLREAQSSELQEYFAEQAKAAAAAE